ncbi:probable carboxylesterase 2 [Mangifera indica]|uniref:probable carboxylesterase 2 n=1 Tax=Mangifera indica TaxID=29780 RepID=UPI001CFA1B82|nr:probable carboxylesterase 2 [Mangifera indica]
MHVRRIDMCGRHTHKDELIEKYKREDEKQAPLIISNTSLMESSTKPQIQYEFLPLIRVYKNGHVERLLGTDFVPAATSNGSLTGVLSKDIIIKTEPNISARLYLPKSINTNQKLPLLVYFHGGGFFISSPFTSKYNNYLNTLVAEASLIAVSVNYRKAPEHPIPAAYEDSWEALTWVVSHCNGDGPESWLNDHADFGRVFLSGESAGANIAHNMAIFAGHPEFGLSVPLLGVALVHPYFWGSDPIGTETANMESKAATDRLWPLICPLNPDNDDPRVNPLSADAPSLVALGCKRVLICVAENDVLKDRGWAYYQELSRCGWMGVAEIMETDGEGHGFHLSDLQNEKAKDLIQRLAAFFNREMPPLL